MEKIVEITKEIPEYENDINLETFEEYIKNVLEDEYYNESNKNNEKPVYVSILLTNNKKITEINNEFRDKDMPTDVISFAFNETENVAPFDVLGDIIISLEKVEEQAKEYNHDYQRELYFLVTHGILHLLGYDHIEEDDKKIMRKKEEDVLSSLEIFR